MLVAFTGGKSHGKSTAAQALIELGYAHLNFTDPLKQACKLIFGLTDEEMEDAGLKETPLARWPFLSPRVILQHVGTDLFRDWLDGTWVNAFERRVGEVDGPVVCSDLRFLNEEAKLREMGAVIVRIVNPSKPAPDASQHRGESSQLAIVPDYTIVNDGTVDDLKTMVLALVGSK